jgi:hypothetical protein
MGGDDADDLAYSVDEEGKQMIFVLHAVHRTALYMEGQALFWRSHHLSLRLLHPAAPIRLPPP